MRKQVPLFFTKTIITPKRSLPIQIRNRNERKLVLRYYQSQQYIGLVYKNGSVIQDVGCFVSIDKLLAAHSGGMLDVLTQGEHRFKIRKHLNINGMPHARVSLYNDVPIIKKAALDKQIIYIKRVLKKWAIKSHFHYSPGFIKSLTPFQLSFFPPSLSLFSTFELQALLETRFLKKRLSLIEARMQEALYKRVILEELSSHLTEAFEKETILN